MEGKTQTQVTFADKLNALISSLACDSHGNPMSASKFADDFNARSEVSMSKGYLSELRSGAVNNPRIDLVEAIAQYFGISNSYFFGGPDDELNVERVLLLGAMRRSNVSNLGARTEGLSPDGIRRIRRAIEAERSREGLAE